MDRDGAQQKVIDAKERLGLAVEEYFASSRELDLLDHECDDPECIVTRSDAIHSTGTWVVLAERNAIAGDFQAVCTASVVHGSFMASVGMAVDYTAKVSG